MKSLLYLAALLLFFAGCTESIYKDGPEFPEGSTTDIQNLLPDEAYTVPIKAGYTTYVLFGGDTLAIADSDHPLTIMVPKGTAKAKSGGVVPEYILGTDPNAGSSQMWQTIAFEDSKTGDYDYNDLVIHCKYVCRGDNNLYIGIHPIALGSTKNIALGCRVYRNKSLISDKIVSSNCRRDLFDDLAGFVNTTKLDYHFNLFHIKLKIENAGNSLAALSVVWYIQTDEGSLFAVNDMVNCLDAEYRPYGIITTNTGRLYYQSGVSTLVGANWFSYPLESQNISDCYPNFDKWLTGEISNFSADNAHNVFPIYDPNSEEKSIYMINPGKNPW